MKRLGIPQGAASLVIILTSVVVVLGAEQLAERQNPAFITALPTVAATTLSTASTPPPPLLTPNTSLDSQPAPIFTPSPSTTDVPFSSAPLSPAILPTSPAILSTSPPAIISSRPTATRPTQAAASAVEVKEDHYFGGTPGPNPDVPVTAIFLVTFVTGALVYGWIHWKNVKRPTRGGNGDRLSALMICFCLAEALICVFRIVWASTDMRPAIVFFALVSESIG